MYHDGVIEGDDTDARKEPAAKKDYRPLDKMTS